MARKRITEEQIAFAIPQPLRSRTRPGYSGLTLKPHHCPKVVGYRTNWASILLRLKSRIPTTSVRFRFDDVHQLPSF